MTDAMTPEADLPLSWIAHHEMESILYAHSTSRIAIQLIANDPDLGPVIEAQFQINSGFPQSSDATKVQDAAKVTIEKAKEIVASDFQYLRRSSLIALCASFEHLTKCLLVDWAELAPEKLNGLDQLKISLQASEFLDSDQRDRLFVVADKAYQDAPTTRGYSEKLQYIIRTYLPEKTEIFRTTLGSINHLDFNEAFLVRNCLVHHGAKANRPLSKIPGFELGAPIVFDAKSLARYFSAIRGFGQALSACDPYSL